MDMTQYHGHDSATCCQFVGCGHHARPHSPTCVAGYDERAAVRVRTSTIVVRPPEPDTSVKIITTDVRVPVPGPVVYGRGDDCCAPFRRDGRTHSQLCVEGATTIRTVRSLCPRTVIPPQEHAAGDDCCDTCGHHGFPHVGRCRVSRGA